MFLIDSIVAAVATAFTTDPDMYALVPGGIWHQRAPSGEQSPLRPYALLAVMAGDKEWTSAKEFIQSFTVAIRLYGTETTDETGEIAGYLGKWDLSRTVLVGLPAKIIGLFPAPENIDLDPETKLGSDVVIATKAWQLILHASPQ